MERNPEVEAFLLEYYDVMKRGASPVDLLSPDLTAAIGSDDEEWSTSAAAEVRAWLLQADAIGPLEVQAGSPRGYAVGEFGWFEDRALLILHDGTSLPVRVTGVVRHEGGRWRALQTHLSVGMPNIEWGLDLPRGAESEPGRHRPGQQD